MLSVASIVVSLLAVAIAVWGARSSSRSANEARKARLDAYGPRLTLLNVHGARERWVLPSHPADRVPSVVKPSVQFTLPGDAEVRLMLGAYVSFVNEGNATALVRLSGFAEFVSLRDPSELDPDTGDPDLPVRRFDGRYVLRPGAEHLVLLRDGPTVAEWATRNGSGTVTVTIEATTENGAVMDRWEVKVSGDIAQNVVGNASAWMVRAHVPASAELRMFGREYQS